MLSLKQSLIVAFMSVWILALTPPSRTQAISVLEPAAIPSPYDLIDAVNALRSSYGLPPYNISSILMAAAQGHADYMAATGTVSHSGLGGSSVTDRLLAAGYPLAGDLSLGGFRSENITSGNEAKSARDVIDGWSGDDLHLTTMISPNLTEIGAGVSANGGRVYFVIDCAQPTGSGIPQAIGTSAAGGSTVVAAGDAVLPVVVVTPNEDGDIIHEVKAGQTLWQIAISYETKVDEIKRLNDLYDDDIYPGTKLLIKKGAILSPSAPIENVTTEAVTTSTRLPTTTATFRVPPLTPTSVRAPISTSTNTVIRIAIGIIALALLGGGFFVRWGSPKRNDSGTKE